MSCVFLYARVSTVEQTAENQIAEAKAAGFAIRPNRIIKCGHTITVLDYSINPRPSNEYNALKGTKMTATEIEAYCQAHQYTISAFGSLSTFAAVVVSLWLARRADLALQLRF